MAKFGHGRKFRNPQRAFLLGIWLFERQFRKKNRLFDQRRSNFFKVDRLRSKGEASRMERRAG
jgi:hypothetical protein